MTSILYPFHYKSVWVFNNLSIAYLIGYVKELL